MCESESFCERRSLYYSAVGVVETLMYRRVGCLPPRRIVCGVFGAMQTDFFLIFCFRLDSTFPFKTRRQRLAFGICLDVGIG